MREDLDRQGVLMQMSPKIAALGKRYLTPVSYLPQPDARKAMFFLKETVAAARRVFLEDGYDLWATECSDLAVLLEKSPWYGKARELLSGHVAQVNLPNGTKDLLQGLFWESKIASEEGFSLDEAAFITAGKALNAREPEAFLLRDATVRNKRAAGALAAGCSPAEARDVEEAFALAVRRGGELFGNCHHFQGFLNWRAQFVANGLVSSEVEIPARFDEIKGALRRELFESHRAAFQYFGGLVDQKPEAVFDRFFQEWEAFVSSKLCS